MRELSLDVELAYYLNVMFLTGMLNGFYFSGTGISAIEFLALVFAI